jgi:protein SCO1/2
MKIFFATLLVLLALVSCRQEKEEEKQEPVVLPFYTAADFTPQWIEPTAPGYRSIHSIPPFSFINQAGDSVTEKTVTGKIYVADFFFTSCPGICKRLSTNLAMVQEVFRNDSSVMLLSHSVTPESDSVPRLKQYADAFGAIPGKWNLVTGNRQQIYRIAREAYFADEDMGRQKNENDFLHTENFLLIDAHRRIRGVYKGTSVADVNNLIADIKTLQAEK